MRWGGLQRVARAGGPLGRVCILAIHLVGNRRFNFQCYCVRCAGDRPCSAWLSTLIGPSLSLTSRRPGGRRLLSGSHSLKKEGEYLYADVSIIAKRWDKSIASHLLLGPVFLIIERLVSVTSRHPTNQSSAYSPLFRHFGVHEECRPDLHRKVRELSSTWHEPDLQSYDFLY